jgi:hypothetical protein
MSTRWWTRWPAPAITRKPAQLRSRNSLPRKHRAHCVIAQMAVSPRGVHAAQRDPGYTPPMQTYLSSV